MGFPFPPHLCYQAAHLKLQPFKRSTSNFWGMMGLFHICDHVQPQRSTRRRPQSGPCGERDKTGDSFGGRGRSSYSDASLSSHAIPGTVMSPLDALAHSIFKTPFGVNTIAPSF